MSSFKLSPSKLSTILDSLSDPIVVLDSQWHITYVNQQAEAYWGIESDDLIGRHLWQKFPEALGSVLHQRFIDAMASREPTEFEARSPHSGRWLRLRLHPVEDGLLIYFHDISEVRESKVRLEAEHAVTQVLSDHHSIDEAAPAILEAVCQGLDAQAGSLWVTDNNQEGLRCVEVYNQLQSQEGKDFSQATWDTRFKLGEGLPGRVYQSMSPEWIWDLVTDDNFPRGPFADAAGLQSGFAFPIRTGAGFFGVMEFFTTHRVELGTPMLEMMSSIGSEIGQFIQRWQAEQAIHTAELHHRAVLESALDCIITMNREGLITEFNPAAEQTFGYRREDVIGETLADHIIPEEYREAHWQGLQRFLESGEGPLLGTRIEMPALHADGTTFPSELTITQKQLPNGEYIFTGYLRDISERKHFEAQLVEAKEKAEEMTRLKSSLLRNMSHEIRTPLTSLLAWTSILEEIEPTDPRHATAMTTIRRSAHRLSETVDSVLMLAQLEGEALKPRVEPIDVCEASAEICQELRPMAEEKGLWLRHSCEAPGICANLDATLFRRILANLISNGVKFTETGGVSVSILDEGHDVAIRVRDTGIGISADFIPNLFEEFHQESTGYSRSHEGTGLGLAISKRLVEQMGGSISPQSHPGRGSTFTVVFPQVLQDGESADSAVPPQQQAEAADDKPSALQELSDADPVRILVVEDNPSIKLVVTDALRRHSIVREFSNAEMALKCAKDERFDLVLMDISLPGINGIEATKRLREMEGYADTPIIAITGHALPGDRERLLAEPFDAYIAKPFTIEALTRQVNSVLQGTT